DLSGDLSSVPVQAAPTATASPSPTPSPTPTRTPAPSATPSRTPTAPAAALPDLDLQDFGIITQGASAGFLRVDIANVGAADLVNAPIEIVGFDQTGAQVLHLTTGPLTIQVGSFQSITTGYRPTQRTMLTVVINPNGTIREADAPPGFPDLNNSLTKTVTPP
ncbi:MAG TPA: hypothetical protein VFA70_07490, partial [Dehalococcoidia bacterium]|nr:hypothetical protein [Dehalococcoidia bacterium]